MLLREIPPGDGKNTPLVIQKEGEMKIGKGGTHLQIIYNLVD